MIPVGTACWIVFTAPTKRRYMGKVCVVTKHGNYGTGPLGTHNCMVLVEGEEIPGAFKCLVPIGPITDAKRTKSPRKKKVPA